MDIRNIVIIAHVDHGKTTLVDGMLKQTHTFRENEAEMSQTTILDSSALEREKGITILAKNTAVTYNNTKINIIDTPGHADFSGEVERTIRMADGAVLVVDAAEGPLPQTQFVLEQAFTYDLKIIVVINKIDRKDARPKEVLREIDELFLHLAHHEEHLTFPVLYAVGRYGKTWHQLPGSIDEPATLEPLFNTILKYIPPPQIDTTKPFQLLVSTLDFDTYQGTYAIGKISYGRVKPGQSVIQLCGDIKIGQSTVEKVYTSVGLKRKDVNEGDTGDIVAISGITNVAIGQTLADPTITHGFPMIKVEDPTLKISISANTSPLSGRDGKFCTARQIHDRLVNEQKTNIGLKIESNDGSSAFTVSGRGELHLAILLETLRREGYEMQVGKPEVIIKDIDGALCEPYEEMTVEIDNQYIGIISEDMGKRRAELVDTHTNERGVTRSVYKISSRNLLGFRSDILTRTRGNGLFATRVIGYFPISDRIQKLRNGVLISLETGKSSAYALTTVQERGQAFIGPGVDVYEGMIIGLNSRQNDIGINVCKTKRLTNIHSANADIAIQLDPPMVMSLEQALDFIEEDELLEITPHFLRLRKKHLSQIDRVRAKRAES